MCFVVVAFVEDLLLKMQRFKQLKNDEPEIVNVVDSVFVFNFIFNFTSSKTI